MKQVSFFPRVTIREIPNKSAFTPHDKEAMWYNRNELQCIRQNCRNVVSAYRDGNVLAKMMADQPEEERCFRGLENHSSFSREHRHIACAAVLCAQQQQQQQQAMEIDVIDDSDEIVAQVYQKYTVLSQRIANLRGAQDEQAASSDERKYWGEHDKEATSSSNPTEMSYSIPTSSSDDSSIRQVLSRRQRLELLEANLIASKAA